MEAFVAGKLALTAKMNLKHLGPFATGMQF